MPRDAVFLLYQCQSQLGKSAAKLQSRGQTHDSTADNYDVIILIRHVEARKMLFWGAANNINRKAGQCTRMWVSVFSCTHYVSFHHRDTEPQRNRRILGAFLCGSVSLWWALSGKE